MNRRTAHILFPISFIIVIAGIGATVLVQQYLNQHYQVQALREIRVSTARVRVQLEEIISTDLSTIHAMASYIAVHPDLDYTQFAAYARQIIGNSTTLRNLVAAKDLVISYVYPLKGNESILGVDYRDVRSQLSLVLEARDTGRLVVAGPVEIIQGGTGIIGRAPVYVAAGTGNATFEEGDFWGIVSSVISFEEVINQLYPVAADNSVVFSLRGVDGTGESGDVFYGEPSLFDSESAVIQDIPLPTGSWQLAVAPTTQHLDRHPHWFLVHGLALVSVGVLLFLTYSKVRSDALLRESEGRLERYVRIVDDNVGIIQTDCDGVLSSVSTALCSISGYSREELIGRSVEDLVSPQTPGSVVADIRKTAEEGNTWHGELELRKKSGTVFWVESDISTLRDDTGRKIGYLAVNQDITDRKDLEVVSFTDHLTGLFNRQKTDHVLEEQRERYSRYGEEYSVIIFDIDHFKQINDNNGHLEGDRVLRTVAEIISAQIRKTDIAGRWGGEEFLILCPHTDQQGAAARAEALRKSIERYDFGLSSRVTASFGVAGVDNSMIDMTADSLEFTEAILKTADNAMYQAKMDGRNAVKVAGQSQS